MTNKDGTPNGTKNDDGEFMTRDYLGMHICPELSVRIRRAAKKERRSLSNFLELVLERAMEDYEKRGGEES
jgi:hypothetical protein